MQETAGGFADTAADAPTPKLSLEGKNRAWLGWFVSEDPPGRALLNVTMLLSVAVLWCAPFVFAGSKAPDVAARICIFLIPAASYDLRLGFRDSVSFANSR